MMINSEKGQVLPLVMIAVVLGALVIPPFLGYGSSSMIGSRTYADALESEYACDSGVEHAIWNLTYGDARSLLTTAGSTITYTLNETLNGLTTNVTISNTWQPIASDNFNSGTWNGGIGWLDDWTYSGSASITGSGTPYEGPYHLRLNNSAVVTRSVNLKGQILIHLIVWAKFSGWQSSDTASLYVSSDGVNWFSAYTWRDGQDDGIYHSYDIDLSSYEMTSRFYIRFQSSINNGTIYFDKLDIVWETPYPTTIAWEDFESGGWAGGGGWTDNWTHSGYSSVTSSGSPHGGLYHLMEQSSTGDVRRSVDLSAAGVIIHLKYWAKLVLNGSDWAEVQVSPDGINWYQTRQWDKKSQSGYYQYDDDLSPYQMTSRFWIRFSIHGNQTTDYFYIDDILVVNLDCYLITSTAGDRVIKAIVQINGTTPVVRYWYFI